MEKKLKQKQSLCIPPKETARLMQHTTTPQYYSPLIYLFLLKMPQGTHLSKIPSSSAPFFLSSYHYYFCFDSQPQKLFLETSCCSKKHLKNDEDIP